MTISTCDAYLQLIGMKHYISYITVKKCSNTKYICYIHYEFRAIPEPSVIVLDNASYHNELTEESRAPTSSWRKAAIQEWLHTRVIPYPEGALKPELLRVAKLHKPVPVSVLMCHKKYMFLQTCFFLSSSKRLPY